MTGARSGASAEYLADESLQDRAERNLEVAAQEGIIPPELAERLAAMARFRNVLTHGYVAIDPRLVYRSLREIDDLREFIALVFKYLANT